MKKGKVYLKKYQKSGFFIEDVIKLEEAYNEPCDLFEGNDFNIDDHMIYKKEVKSLSVYVKKNDSYHKLKMKNGINEKLFNKVNVNDVIYFDDKGIYLNEVEK